MENHPFIHFNVLELLPSISEQSPNLQSFCLPFANQETVAALFPTLETFNFLTCLSLVCVWNSHINIHFLPFFTALGPSCPKLISFNLVNFEVSTFFGFDHLLALVIGKKREVLPQQLLFELNDNHSSFAHLYFSRQCVTPICSNLLELNIGDLTSQQSAFTLRHFPKLKKCQASLTDGGVSGAVCLLWQQQQRPDVIPSTTNLSSKELGCIEWTINAPFHGNYFTRFSVFMFFTSFFKTFRTVLGQLNLIKLDGIDYKSRMVMVAITALCPLLHEAHFQNNQLFFYPSSTELLSPQRLHSILSTSKNCWSNVLT
jgi:hypothetical protein